MSVPDLLRRRAAAEYLEQKYGYRGGYQGLSVLAMRGNGPEMRYAGRLEQWYEGRFGPPVKSTATKNPRGGRRARSARDERAASSL